MKILVIGTTENQGGAARVGWDIGSELIGRGHDVKYIVGYKTSGSKNVYELSKPFLLKWLDEHTRYHVTSLVRHLWAYITSNNIDRGASSEITNHPWYKDADIVHLHNLHGNFFKLQTLIQICREKKVVWTLHDMWPLTGKCAYIEDQSKWEDGYHSCNTLSVYPPMLWDNTRYMWHKKASIYKDLKNIHVVSPSTWLLNIAKKSMLKHLPISLIPNGVDNNIFVTSEKTRVRQELGLPQGKKIIIFTAQSGTTDPRKGWVFVEQVIAKYKNQENVHFVCIGSGTSISNVSNITTIPFIEDKKMLAKYYAASDFLLFTSLAENCPLVVLEAMSCGLPVVSFDVGGVPELVTHKINGYIAKHKDGDDLTRGVGWILSLSKQDYLKISSLNRQKVEDKYSIARMTDQYEDLLKRLLISLSTRSD